MSLYRRLQPACPVPVTDGTYPLLSALLAGPASAAHVCVMVGVDRTVIIKQAGRLQASGLLTRSPDPDDARATLLCLTPAGRDAALGMRRAALELIGELSTREVDQKDLAAASTVLQVMHALVHEGLAVD